MPCPDGTAGTKTRNPGRSAPSPRDGQMTPTVTVAHGLIEGEHESSGGMMKRTWLALAAGLALVVTSAGTASATERLPAGDAPPGFWWGTDSFNVSVPGKGPYSMPFLGGAYGGYIGMTGNWAYWQGCSGQEHFIAYSSANAAQAHTNFVTYHKGVGRGAYWFMGGPGVDPHWNGTAAEAYKWGAQQASRALIDIANGGGIDYPVVWMDIEIPGIGPATDNGWNTVYTTPCSGRVKQQHILASIDRADFNGFYDYVTRTPSTGRVSTPPSWCGTRSSAATVPARAAPATSRAPTSGPTSLRPPTTRATSRPASA